MTLNDGTKSYELSSFIVKFVYTEIYWLSWLLQQTFFAITNLGCSLEDK